MDDDGNEHDAELYERAFYAVQRLLKRQTNAKLRAALEVALADPQNQAVLRELARTDTAEWELRPVMSVTDERLDADAKTAQAAEKRARGEPLTEDEERLLKAREDGEA